MAPKFRAVAKSKSPAPPKAKAGTKARAKSPGRAATSAPAKVLTPEERVRDAELLLRGLSPSALASLAKSDDATEQLVARTALAYVGDEDVSWASAQNQLVSGVELMTKIYERNGANLITRRSLDRILTLFGEADASALDANNSAARAFAVYFDACIQQAKEHLGLNDDACVSEPKWPVVAKFKDVFRWVSEAAYWRKTSLFVCNGHAEKVDTFFKYRGFKTIDAKWVLGETALRKTISFDDMHENLREELITAMKYGLPFHISMSNSAVSFSEKYCAEGVFPRAVFNLSLWDDPLKESNDQEYSKILRDSDLTNWTGNIRDGFCVVITSDFSAESAIEHLAAALPHVADMAIIELDVESFE